MMVELLIRAIKAASQQCCGWLLLLPYVFDLSIRDITSCFTKSISIVYNK